MYLAWLYVISAYQQYILNMFHIKLNMFFITYSVLPQITEMTNKIHFIGHSRFNFKTRCSRYLCLIYDSAKTHSSQYLQAFVIEKLAGEYNQLNEPNLIKIYMIGWKIIEIFSIDTILISTGRSVESSVSNIILTKLALLWYSQ